MPGPLAYLTDHHLNHLQRNFPGISGNMVLHWLISGFYGKAFIQEYM